MELYNYPAWGDGHIVYLLEPRLSLVRIQITNRLTGLSSDNDLEFDVSRTSLCTYPRLRSKWRKTHKLQIVYWMVQTWSKEETFYSFYYHEWSILTTLLF